MVEVINKPAAVIALFEDGKIKPLRVKFANTVYHVKKVNTVWRETVGATKYIHIAVETKEDATLELVVDPNDLSWRLERITTTGV